MRSAPAALAAVLLFTTPPSDRALDGWCFPLVWLVEELDDLGVRELIALWASPGTPPGSGTA